MKIKHSFIAIFALVAHFSSGQGTNSNSSYFEKIKKERVNSDPSIEWKNFGPGMSGYCEEFWVHPTEPDVMFMGPDMHVSFGTWDGGNSWHTIKDSDGLGQDMKRVLDIEFSRQNPDFGMALDWNGWLYRTNNKGRTWERTIEFGKYGTETYNTNTNINTNTNNINTQTTSWYPEQLGARLGELAVDPSNDNVWYVGAGDFWNVKANHRSLKNPNGIKLKYAAYGYIWKTLDKGKTWKKITNGLPKNTEVGKLIVNPNNSSKVVMATNVGLLTSDDAGLSWKNNAKGLPNNSPRDLFAYYNPQSKNIVLYLVEQTVYQEKDNTVESIGGVFRSNDFGLTWENITGNLYVDLNKINFSAEIDRYYKTISYWLGISKEAAKKKFPKLPNKALPVFNRLVVNPLNSEEIYVTFNKKHDYTFGSGDVWKTDNGGKTWYACARQGSYWNSDKDLEYWQSRNNPTGSNMKFAHLQVYMDGQAETSGNRMMEINSKGEVFIGVDQQTLKTSDHGKTWEQIDDYETSPGSNKWIGKGGSDLPGRFMLHETGIKGRRLLCSGEHGLWQTTDIGAWPDKQAVAVEQIDGQVQDVNKGKGAHSIATVAVHPKNPNIIYTLMWRQEHRGKLRRSTDGGKTWENISTIFEGTNNEWEKIAYQNALKIDPVNPNNMYFTAVRNPVGEVGSATDEKLFTKGSYGVYRSFDGGYNWEPANNGFHPDASIRRITLDPDNPNTIYAALNDNNGGLYKSDNKGNEWKKVKIPSEIKAVNSVFIDRNTKHIYISAGRSRGSYEEGGVWRSKDNGKTWDKIFKAPFVWQTETSPINPELIVISVAGQSVKDTDDEVFMNPGVYLSSDGGKSWKKINKGLGQPDKIVDVKPDPYNEDVLWCASWGCGWFVTYLNGTKEGWLRN